MYKSFFGLTEYPFNLTPDPRFVVVTPGYNETLAGLYYGIEMAKGLTVITGEVGTGKTMALRWMCVLNIESSTRALKRTLLKVMKKMETSALVRLSSSLGAHVPSTPGSAAADL